MREYFARFCYFAYPIDQSANHADRIISLVNGVQHALAETGVIAASFDPGDAFTLNDFRKHGEGNPTIAAINAMAHAAADLVVAFLPAGVATVGVPIEIDRAVLAGKATVVITDVGVSYSLNYDRPNLLRVETDEPHIVARQIEQWIRSGALDVVGNVGQEPLPFMLIDPEAKLPTRSYKNDAGFDLYTSKDVHIDAGGFHDVPTGVAVELPDYLWGNLVGRSSTWRKYGLNVIQGVIDPGYRGELFVGIHNPSAFPIDIEQGTRLAQLILMSNAAPEFKPVQVETLNPSERASNGFGSSGR